VLAPGHAQLKTAVPRATVAWADESPHEVGGASGYLWLKTMLVQCATAASRTKASYLGAQYRRLKTRRGHAKAVVAVAASILTIAYQMLRTGEPYRDLGVDYLTRRDPEREAPRAVRKLQSLGYEVETRKAA
jgi:hypothetical protein